jgi:ribose transport system permease protein
MTATIGREAEAAVVPPTGLERVGSLLNGRAIYLLLAVTWAISWSLILLDGGSVSVSRLLVPAVGLGVIAAGQTAVVIAGSIDLSVAWLVTVCAMLVAAMSDGDGSKLPIAIAATLGVGALVGLINGLVVSGLHVHGFIATLGMALALQGVVALTFAQNAPAKMPDSIVDALGFGSIGPIRWSTVLLIAVTFAVAWLVGRTRVGAHLYAVGGSEEVARLSGIRTSLPIIAAHVTSGLCAAVAGIYLASRLGTPNVEIGTAGLYALESIAVVVLGGAALTGGRGRLSWTFAALIVFVLIDDTFSQLGVNPFLKLVVRGVVIIAAVASYTLVAKEESR